MCLNSNDIWATRGFIKSLSPDQKQIFKDLFSTDSANQNLKDALEQVKHERITSEDQSHTILFAIDYAIERQSYAVDIVIKSIQAHWNEYPDRIQLKVIKIINENLSKAPTSLDKQYWQNILSYCNEQRISRK